MIAASASERDMRSEAPRLFRTTTTPFEVLARWYRARNPWELIIVDSPAELGVMVGWYSEVLGVMPITSPSERPRGPVVAGLLTTSVIVGVAGHRAMILSPPPGAEGRRRRRCRWDQHVAFEYATIDDLLRTYARLEGRGISPFHSAGTGTTTAFYYEDPEGNSVELMIDKGLRVEMCVPLGRRPPDTDRRAILDCKPPDRPEMQDDSGASMCECRRGR